MDFGDAGQVWGFPEAARGADVASVVLRRHTGAALQLALNVGRQQGAHQVFVDHLHVIGGYAVPGG